MRHSRPPHKTIATKVWADIDIGIAPVVQHLNSIKGVRTHTSCQGGRTYRGYVEISWDCQKTLSLLLEHYEILLPAHSNTFWGTLFLPRKEGDKRI